MREVRDIMGMPVILDIPGITSKAEMFECIFEYFRHVDSVFSTYKADSEISRINRREIAPPGHSEEMKEVFALSEKTKEETKGYFDILKPDGSYDPSGLVKGWAIQNAAKLLDAEGVQNFYIDVGGDIQSRGIDREEREWKFGIRNPFEKGEIVKVVYPEGQGLATSGTYIRGSHIYDPFQKKLVDTPFVSLTVLGPDIYEADRFATAAFAMGEKGIHFLESQEGLEAYAIDAQGIATMTQGFETYTIPNL